MLAPGVRGHHPMMNAAVNGDQTHYCGRDASVSISITQSLRGNTFERATIRHSARR